MKNDKNTFFLLPGSNAPGANCMLLGSPLTGQGAVIMTNGAMGELLNMRLTYTLAKAMIGILVSKSFFLFFKTTYIHIH